MEFRDYYKVLGVERGAGNAEIKSAYRKLARKHHPDVNPGNKQAEERFKEINEAYQVLGDPAKRKKYDELGADWQRGASEEEIFRRYAGSTGAAAGGRTAGDFSDFFERFFGLGGEMGGGFAGARRWGFGDFAAGREAPVRAPDLHAEVDVTVREAMHGGKRRLELAAQDECPACGGTGVVARQEQRGRTRVIRSAEPCPQCGATGIIAARRSLEVTIPAGVIDGTRIRLKGQGGRGPRPELNGDLFLTVRLRPDPVFTVAGRDLRVVLPVWDYEAALGAEVDAPTLNGRLSIRIPPESQTGRVLRLRGKGLPGRDREAAGDLLYELRVLAPTGLTEDERRLMREFAERRRSRGLADPRAELMRG